jgi:hypothetical protein
VIPDEAELIKQPGVLIKQQDAAHQIGLSARSVTGREAKEQYE